MKATINTAARFLIGGFQTGYGIWLLKYFYRTDVLSAPLETNLLLGIGGLAFLAGLFLFLGYKVNTAAILLIGITIGTMPLFSHTFLDFFESLAHIAGLLLLVQNDSGETFLEYAQTDIENVPYYKM
ncbi:hypothetical protein [Fodinibius saliphilus]|uniref:hypothetical protein n=1 Tax=Fodinibius saliphilus TaxID=1920650 RepID=UPI001109F0BE|nr:hypothetical protein [Fodinibius saliphilus]